MKKGTRTALAVAVIVVVALGAPTWRYLYSSKKAMADFTPVDTGAIADGVVAIRDDFVNVWAFEAGDSWILFDAGTDAARLVASLEGMGIKASEVKAIFLTHSDYDHVKAVSRFPNAARYLSVDEAPLVSGKAHRAFVFNNRFDGPYRTLRDGEVTRIGNREIEALVTPGHTPGSTCFLVDGEYLVTGDALGIRDGKIGVFSEFFNMDSGEAARSIGKLFDRPELKAPITILSAHYGVLGDYLAQ
jgi:glyoxylase-like metal-dependent hydrolase (beta-lactamase superfamily II)